MGIPKKQASKNNFRSLTLTFFNHEITLKIKRLGCAKKTTTTSIQLNEINENAKYITSTLHRLTMDITSGKWGRKCVKVIFFTEFQL